MLIYNKDFEGSVCEVLLYKVFSYYSLSKSTQLLSTTSCYFTLHLSLTAALITLYYVKY